MCHKLNWTVFELSCQGSLREFPKGSDMGLQVLNLTHRITRNSLEEDVINGLQSLSGTNAYDSTPTSTGILNREIRDELELRRRSHITGEIVEDLF